MPQFSKIAPSSSIRLLDRFYGLFLLVGIVLLTIGVPFVFYRKTASAVAISTLILAVLIAWRMNRRGQAQKSLLFFALVMWLTMVALIYAGLPATTAGAVVMAMMLAIVVHVRAAAIFGTSYLLAWLLYLTLQSANLTPAPYFPGAMMSGWFVGAVAIGLVLLPIPELVLNLSKAASLQRAVIEAATDGILVVRNNGEIETYNQRFMDFWHIPPEYLSTHNYQDLLDFVAQQLDDPAQFLQKVRDLGAHPDHSSVDTMHCKDGRMFERHSQPQRLDEQVVGRVWSFRDVSERERTQAALRHGKEQFEAILNATSESIFLLARDGVMLAINATAALRVKREPEPLIGQCIFDFFPPDVAATRRATLAEVFRTGQAKYAEDMRADRSFALNYYPVVHPDGAVESVAVFAADMTERKRAEAQLIAREARLTSLMASMQDTVVVLDSQARVLEYFDPQGASHPPFQSPDGERLGKTCDQLLPAAAIPLFSAAIAALLVNDQPQTFMYTVTDAEQTYFFLVTMSHINGAQPGAGEFLTVVRDITVRRNARKEIERLAQRNKLLLDSVGEGIFDIDHAGKMTFTNPAALVMLGLTEAQMLGQDPHALFHHHHEDGSPYPKEQSPVLQVLHDGKRRQLESEWFWRQDGTGFPVSLIVTPVVEEDQRIGSVVVFQDITERRRAEAEIHRLAFHDALTLLPNRRLLNDRLVQMMAACKRSAQYGALLFLDLDNFKPLNDAHGHGVGDMLLVEVARRITRCVRQIDTVARFGGDEFVVMLGKLETDLDAARLHAALVAEKIRLALAQPYHLIIPQDDGVDIQVQHRSTSSIGIALFPEPAASADETLKRADLAMYRAKESGRNAVSF